MQNITLNNKGLRRLKNSKEIINRIESNKKIFLKNLQKEIFCLDIGLIRYQEAYNLQTYFFDQIKKNNGIGIILLLEHWPVITIGNNENTKNLLVSENKLKNLNIELIQSNRGGDVTFHGPGQLVGYPIFNLSYFKKDITLYVYNLEQAIINLLKEYKINSRRIPEHRGVFVDSNKIASIGIRIKRWTTMHGFSLNVNVNLGYFDYIIACGLKNYPQTSIKKLLKKEVSIYNVKEQILEKLSQIFNYHISYLDL